MATAPPTTKPPVSKPGTPPPPAAAAKPAPTIKPPTVTAKPSPQQRQPAKTFSIVTYSGAEEGEKVVLYGKSGVGKTTLAAMAPGAVFIPLDDGARKIVNPLTGQPVAAIPSVQSHQDLRDALNQRNLWQKGTSLIIDTMTMAEVYAERAIVEEHKIQSMRKLGWDGPSHILEKLRLVLTDLDVLVKAGVNVILLCQLAQATIANAEGVDYLEDGPKLASVKNANSRTELCEWADHVLRVGYLEFAVQKDSDKAKTGKVVSTDATRAVFSGGAQHFIAKSRPVSRNREVPYRIPTVIPFSEPNDNSLWSYIFDGAVAAE